MVDEIAPIEKLREIRFGENLPKTRSDKIMRRLFRERQAWQTEEVFMQGHLICSQQSDIILLTVDGLFC